MTERLINTLPPLALTCAPIYFDERRHQRHQCRPYANAKDYIQLGTADGLRQPSRLFIAVGVPEDTVFETKTRKEIETIQWHSLTGKLQGKRSNHVGPFLGGLRKWMKTKRGKAVCKAAMKKGGIKPKSPTASPALAGIQPGLLPTPMLGSSGSGGGGADGGILNELLSTLKIPQSTLSTSKEPNAPLVAPAPPLAAAAGGGGGMSLAAWAANILHTPPAALTAAGTAAAAKSWAGQPPPKPVYDAGSSAAGASGFKFDVGAIMAHFP